MAETKKKKKNRLGYMIFSVILAIFVWAAIAYTNDRSITKTFHDAEFTVKGEDELKKEGLIVTDINTKKLSYKISGRRNDLVTSMDGVAFVIDTSDITEAGVYNLEYSVKGTTPRLQIETDINTVPVTIGKYIEKEIPVEIRQTGVLRDKLVKSESSVSSIHIGGCEEEINDIARGVITINISDIEKSGQYLAKYVFEDYDGGTIAKNKTVEAEVSELKITNTIYNVETVPIELVLSEELSSEYVIDEHSTSVTPHTIDIGSADGYSFDKVYARITDIEGGTIKYELMEKEGMYIPESSRDIEIRLTTSTREPLEALN